MCMRRHWLIALLIVSIVAPQLTAQQYEPTWESLDKRPTPAWFDQGKFGIFIHWGVYAVPAYAPKGQYSEWYWRHMQDKSKPTWEFHEKTYGQDFQYQDFAPMFKAELFNPDAWAKLFKKSGARYVVLTSKHHDGFCLWPSSESWNWNSVDIGPHRDLAGELTKAVKAQGLKMGFYYSLYEWFHPHYQNQPERYVSEHMIPQMKDLITRYEPDLLWGDGEWNHPSDFWHTREFLAWLFNESSVAETIAINDRWGKDTRSRHGGFYTTEYGKHHGLEDLSRAPKWEECRGMGASFGYNRNEDIEDYKSAKELIHLLIETVSKGGNLLLDIGPTADGRIPVIMQERLMQIGDWLQANGAAIYGTRPFLDAEPHEQIRFTATKDAIFAICLERPAETLAINLTRKIEGSPEVRMLGSDESVRCEADGSTLTLKIPETCRPTQAAYVFQIMGIPTGVAD